MIRALLALALGALPALAIAADRCDVEYRFTARWDEKPRRFDVDLLFDAGQRTSTELTIAEEWGPVHDFGRAIRRVRPIAPAAVVSHAGDRPASWIVDHPAGARVHVRYEMRNDVANVDDTTPLSHVDFYRTMLGATWFQFYGNGGLLVPQGGDLDRPVSACLSFSGLPKDWAFGSSQGEGRRHGDAIEIRTRTSLNKLDATLFLGGDFRLYRRPMDGGALVVAMRGHWPFTDADFVDTTARVMRAHRAFWPDRIAHYLVSFIPNRTKRWNSGGTGLYHSFAMHASDDFTVPGSAFDHLIGHEDIHTWVPHRLGTVGDEEAAQYWFSEGVTDYLTHRLLVTAGVWSLDDFAKQLNRRILLYGHSPYRNATNAALARDYWKNGIAERMPYVRGELLALRWDKALLARGETLQQVLRSLLLPDEAAEDDARNRPDRLAALRLVSALRSRLGPSLDRDIAQFVDEGRPIPFTDDFLGPCFAGRTVKVPAFELGFDVSTLQSHVLTGVVPGSAAERAGLRDGMRLAQFSIQYDTVDGNVGVRVADGETLRTIRYLPRGDHEIELHEYAPRLGAARDPACRAWIEAR